MPKSFTATDIRIDVLQITFTCIGLVGVWLNLGIKERMKIDSCFFGLFHDGDLLETEEVFTNRHKTAYYEVDIFKCIICKRIYKRRRTYATLYG